MDPECQNIDGRIDAFDAYIDIDITPESGIRKRNRPPVSADSNYLPSGDCLMR